MAGEIPDDNPALVSFEKKDGYYIQKTTHAKPTTKTEIFRVDEAQAEIDKYDGAIALFEAKKLKPQAGIDRYDSLPEPVPGPGPGP